MQDLHALVVEDDPDISSALVETLEGAGFRVTSARDGKEAVDVAASDPPDLVTLDLTLPHMDGIEVCRRIRERSDCYIVIVSARSDEVDKLIGLEVGADDFVLKPFRVDTIFETISIQLGVDFEYEFQPETRDESFGILGMERSTIDITRISALPTELLERLERELRLGDDQAALETTAAIAEVDSKLAHELSRAISAFQFDRLLTLLDDLGRQRSAEV